jgi:hypothetical protein
VREYLCAEGWHILPSSFLPPVDVRS